MRVNNSGLHTSLNVDMGTEAGCTPFLCPHPPFSLPHTPLSFPHCCCVTQEVGVHVMAPANVLAQDPLPHAVAVQPLTEVATASQNGGHSLPPGVTRFAVTIDGTESEEQVASLKGSEAAMALLQIAPGVSQVHASRRIFELLQRHDVDIAVIHLHRSAELNCCSSARVNIAVILLLMST